MRGLLAVYLKEMEDHFSSVRSILLLTVILMISLITAYMAATGLRKELEGIAKPSLVFLMLFTSTGAMMSLTQFISFFGPLIGMVLGFDAINRERTSRTLSKLLSQPIYRDAVINGKFLAGLTTVALMMVSIVLLISGIGLQALGVVPGGEEVGRQFIYLVVSIVYIGFWLGVAILCSVLFRGMATSALATFALWIFFALVVPLVAPVLASAIAPLPPSGSNDFAAALRNVEMEQTLSLASPVNLYTQATSVVLNPYRKATRPMLIGPMEQLSISRFQSPLPLLQSTLIVAPYLVLLVALTFICFGICYACFMRQEVRST